MAATLIYDGSCPLCNAAREWVERNALAGRFEYLPCQSDERARRFPEMPEHECMEAMQLVTEDGQTFSGDRALPQILSRLRRWRWLANVLRVPPASWVSPSIYRLIARNRMAISALVERKPAQACPVDGASRTRGPRT